MAWPGTPTTRAVQAAWCSARSSATWWAERPDALRGQEDARDALRAHALAATIPAGGGGSGFAGGSAVAALAGLVSGAKAGQTDWWQDLLRQFTGNPPSGLAHPAVVRHVTSWLVAEHANGPVIDESLDALEATLASVPGDVLTTVAERSPRLIQPAGTSRRATGATGCTATPGTRCSAACCVPAPSCSPPRSSSAGTG